MNSKPLETVKFEGGSLDGEHRRWRPVWAQFVNPTCIYIPRAGSARLWEFYERVTQGPGVALARFVRSQAEEPKREYKPRGWQRGRSRLGLTPDVVREIRNSPLSLGDVAIEYGISKSTAWDIRSGKTWSHVK